MLVHFVTSFLRNALDGIPGVFVYSAQVIEAKGFELWFCVMGCVQIVYG
jgi:hypothetical protein